MGRDSPRPVSGSDICLLVSRIADFCGNDPDPDLDPDLTRIRIRQKHSGSETLLLSGFEGTRVGLKAARSEYKLNVENLIHLGLRNSTTDKLYIAEGKS